MSGGEIIPASALIPIGGIAEPSLASWAPVRLVATTLAASTLSSGVLTADANGALGSIDSVSPSAGDRILYAPTSANAKAGLYTVTSLGSGGAPWVLTRATDANLAAHFADGKGVAIAEGTVYAGRVFRLLTDAPYTLDTTALLFTAQPIASTDITDSTSVGRSVLTAPDAAAARSAIGAGTSSYPDPLTTRGDLVARGASSTGRLAIGASGTYLKSDGTDPAWTAPTASELAASVQTTDASTTTLLTFAIPTDTAWTLGLLVAASTTTGESLGLQCVGSVRNVSGTCAAEDVATVRTDDASPKTWALTVTISGTDALVRVTGEALKTINWRCFGSALRST